MPDGVRETDAQMNVTIVIPPSPFLLSDQTVPWLGPLWVAAWLRQAGHVVTVWDYTGSRDAVGEAYSDALDADVDCYGLTATTPDYEAACEIAGALREASGSSGPRSRVILGGAHATTSSAACYLQRQYWDAVVAGDGFTAAERALERDGVHRATLRGEMIEDIDQLPFPARDLINLDVYNFNVCGERATSVMTAFGCPMGCTFCCGRELYYYRKLRAFSPARVLREWDAIRSDYPQFTALMDYADEWNIPPARAIALADAIAAHPNKWVLRCCVKAEYFTDEVARAMSRAGVVEVLCGIESGSDRILKVINKHTTWEINGRARETAKKHGMRFKALTMVGLPTETREDAMDTKYWLLQFRPDDFDVTVYQPMAGSPIADHPQHEGKGLQFELSTLPYKTVPGEYGTRACTPTLSAEDIVALREEIDTDVRADLGLPRLGRNVEASMGQLVHVNKMQL